MNEDDEPKETFRGLSDIKEYNSDNLPNEYDIEDGNSSKVDFQTFKLPKIMEDYK